MILPVNPDDVKAMLGIAASLYGKLTFPRLTRIHDRESALVTAKRIDQDRHLVWQPCSPLQVVEEPQSAVQDRTTVARVNSAKHQLDQ